MKLYEYDEIIETLYRAQESADGVDSETGMVFDITLLDALEMERDKKIENALLYAEQLKADANEISGYAKRLTERAQAKKNTAESIKQWLIIRMQEAKQAKFETPRIRASLRITKNGKTEFTDKDLLPEEYRKYSWTADTTAIKNAIKNGEQVPGAYLTDSVSLTIK